MNKIKVLSPQEAQKIAAGEVVERPASVCKELLENSLDAGATQITLSINKAGKELIQVIDNGCGMSQDDAYACFLPHATSKITKIEDLDVISSFGFRGEALAAIASVAEITLTTREQEAELATQLVMVDGRMTEQNFVPAAVGTTISIKNLFYNVPARQKFLKQDETEWNQIQNFFQAVSLSHTSIHFKLYKDEKLILNLPPAQDAQERVCQLFEYNFAQNVLPIEAVDASLGLTLTGCISNHQVWKYNRAQQFFFVNNRWVKNNELSKAVTKGYANVLPEGRFAAVFIFIQMDSRFVDVNVHPRKEEVKFTRPLVVANLLQEAIKKALEKNSVGHKTFHKDESLVSFDKLPTSPGLRRTGTTSGGIQDESLVSFDKLRTSGYLHLESVRQPDLLFQNIASYISPAHPEPVEGHERLPQQINDFVSLAHLDSGSATSYAGLIHPDSAKSPAHPELVEGYERLPQQILHQQETFIAEQIDAKVIGQLLNSYILIQTPEGLSIIDQHAMHERILYHKLLANFERKEGTRLMFPLLVTFKESELEALRECFDFLTQQGIELELFGTTQVRVLTAPPQIQQCNLKELLTEFAQFITSLEASKTDKNWSEDFRKKLNEHLHGQMACKAAVKAGDVLTHIQMEQLMADAQKTPLNYICVHGRPTTWKMSAYQLEKVFQRK